MNHAIHSERIERINHRFQEAHGARWGLLCLAAPTPIALWAAWNGDLLVAWSVAAAGLAAAAALWGRRPRAGVLQGWWNRQLGGVATFEELTLEASLPAGARRAKFLDEGSVADRVEAAEASPSIRPQVIGTLVLTKRAAALLLLIALGMLTLRDVERSRVRGFVIPAPAQLPLPVLPVEPRDVAGGEPSPVENGKHDPEDPRTSSWTDGGKGVRVLDPVSTPGVVGSMLETRGEIVLARSAVTELQASVPDLERRLASIDPEELAYELEGELGAAIERVRRGAQDLESLSERLLAPDSEVPADVRHRIEETKQRVERFQQALEDFLQRPDAESLGRLVESLEALSDVFEPLLEALGDWADRIGEFLDDLFGGLSDKAQDLFDQAKDALGKGLRSGGSTSGALDGLAALTESIVEDLGDQVAVDMGKVTVQVSGYDTGSPTVAGGTGSPGSPESPGRGTYGDEGPLRDGAVEAGQTDVIPLGSDHGFSNEEPVVKN